MPGALQCVLGARDQAVDDRRLVGGRQVGARAPAPRPRRARAAVEQRGLQPGKGEVEAPSRTLSAALPPPAAGTLGARAREGEGLGVAPGAPAAPARRRRGSPARASARPCRTPRRRRRRACARAPRSPRARSHAPAACGRRWRSGRGTAARRRVDPRFAGAKEVRRDVPLQMVDRRERQLARGRERLGGGQADQQRADQPGPLRRGDQLDLLERRRPPRSRACSTTTLTSSRWWREAISGTTPPKRSCTSWEEITFERSLPSAPSTAAQVSSQLRLERQDQFIPAALRVGHVVERPRSVAGVRHITSASSPLSW